MEKNGYELYVQKDVSKKGVDYCALVLDLGYRKVFLSTRDNGYTFCSEILGYSVSEFISLPNGIYPVKINNKEIIK